jgi:hypothetical protein
MTARTFHLTLAVDVRLFLRDNLGTSDDSLETVRRLAKEWAEEQIAKLWQLGERDHFVAPFGEVGLAENDPGC